MPNYTAKKVLGSGRIFLSKRNSDGTLEGFRPVLETPEFTIAVATEKFEDFSSDEAVARKTDSVVTQTTYTANFTSKSMDGENMGLYFMGGVETVAQGAGSVADEAVTVKQGLWYPLGLADNKTGVRNIESVVVDDGTTPYVLNTDYELDAVRGQIYIIPGGGIADDEEVLVSYDTVAESRERVFSAGTIFKGAMKFEADNTIGENKDALFLSVTLEPTGDFSVKSRTDPQQVGFAAELLEMDSETAAIYFDGPSAA